MDIRCSFPAIRTPAHLELGKGGSLFAREWPDARDFTPIDEAPFEVAEGRRVRAAALRTFLRKNVRRMRASGYNAQIMSDERNYSPYQKRLIRRYYQNREAASTQRLGEIVTELYLATSEKKAARLWEQVEKHLCTAGANEKWVAGVVADRNLEALAEIVKDLF